MKQRAVVLSPKDNVATVLADLKAGESLEVEAGGKPTSFKMAQDIPFGHKFSLASIAADAPIIKYGEVIGTATTPIAPGDYVHVHNIVSARARGDLKGGKAA